MKYWYTITPEDLERITDFSTLSNLHPDETIHYDPEKPGMPDFKKLMAYLDSQYEYEVTDGVKHADSWFVLKLTAIKK